MLRSDNGKDYTSDRFNQFCEEVGIEHQLTAPCTPQQNGVRERKNKTIFEMTRCLMHKKGFPKEYWAEATNIVVFLLNKLPTKVVDGKTPFEAWYGFKPNMKNLKIFCCLCLLMCHRSRRTNSIKKLNRAFL